jgi:hypothetical protein
LKVKEYFGDAGVQGRIILKLIKKYGVGCGPDSSGSGQGPVTGCSGHGNKPVTIGYSSLFHGVH